MTYEHWQLTRLGDLISIKHGWPFKSQYMTQYQPGKPIVVGIGNFEYSGGFRFGSTTLKAYSGGYPTEFVLKPGDILLVMTCQTPGGEILGIPGRIPNDNRIYLHNQRMGKVIVKDSKRVDMGFLYWLFLTVGFNRHLAATATGTKILHTAPERIESFKFLLPPLPTQCTIASILSAYDELIENNTRRIALLEEMAQMLYQEWFAKFRFPGYEGVRMVETEMGMVPEGWEVVSFFDIANVLSGGTPKTAEPAYWNGDIPFYTPKDAPSSFFVIMTEKSLTEMGLKSCNSHLYPRNTVFITARGTVGRIALNAIAMAMNQSCYALEGREGISQFFLFLHLKNCIRQLKQTANGAVFEAIIVDTFKWLQVLKPPLALIGAFTTMTAPVFDQILNLTMRNANLRRTRDMLLPKLVGGEIDVSGWERMGAEADAINRVPTEVGKAGGYEMRGTRGRGMAQVEPLGQDDLAWRSLWEP
ncbi:MAG TPA: restriction endonuclease subunit S [Ktedonosporobacter sp.]|jgi:type I restriction enzyme S subunit|nr:restriction endonuclease subunit S [Ktedonosporobacter sp.]